MSRAASACPHCGHPLARAGADAGAPVGTAAAARVPPVSPPPPEQVLWQGSPSLKTLALDGVRSALVAAATIVAVIYAYHPLLEACARFSDRSAEFVTAYAPGFRLAATLFVVTVVGARLGRLGWRAMVLRNHAYRVSNQRLTVETGVLSKTLQEIDMRTIEDIALRQSVVERLLGIGRIDIVSASDARAPFTAGASVKARLSMQGIADPRAVREIIRGAAYQATHGQLFTRST